MKRRSPSPRTLLAASIVALLVISQLPERFIGWFGWFRSPLMTIIAPASTPLSRLASGLRPGEHLPRPDTPEGELERQRDEMALHLLRAEARILELEELIRDIQGGVPYQRAVGVLRVEAMRAGSNPSAGTIEVARGRTHGVVEGSVAVSRSGQQLVGIVTSVGASTSTVHLMTDRRLFPNLLEAVAIPDVAPTTAEELAALPRMQLRPAGNGTLVSSEVGVNQAQRMQVGQRVRLDDNTWPSAAAMLVLGRITSIEPLDDPLFRRIIVTPEVDPSGLRSVILFIPSEAGGGR